MNVVIKNIETYLRDIECENIDSVFDVDHLRLIVQLLEMLDDYNRQHSGEVPGTITDLVEWNKISQLEKLPFE